MVDPNIVLDVWKNYRIIEINMRLIMYGIWIKR